MMLIGGRFSYWGGSPCYVDYCDIDKMPIPELNDIMKDNWGLLTPPTYYFKVHGEDKFSLRRNR